jgi:hypothetical protein
VITIKDIEKKTGHHAWERTDSWKTDGTVKGYQQDWYSLSAHLSGVAAVVLVQRAQTIRLQGMFALILEESNRYCSAAKDMGIEYLLPKMKELSNSMQHLEQYLGAGILGTAELYERASSQMSALFNMIAQRDQSLSIGIARDLRMLAVESQRDGSSMKTVAVMTMAFLPGTFVAVGNTACDY